MRILVIGGTGFVGRSVVARLVDAGHEVCVPTRQLAHARKLQMLPTVSVVLADIYEDTALRSLVQGCDVVINLPGILHSRAGQPDGVDFEQVHVHLPKRVAQACLAGGVMRLVHVSALGADMQGPSGYLRSKAAGEAAIAEVYRSDRAVGDTRCTYTILRPSVIFGPDDQFMNMFARLARIFPVLPLAGSLARMQPIYVGDVAQAIVNVMTKQVCAGQTYELAGPRIYSLGELVGLAARWSGHPRPVLKMPMVIGRLQALLFECLPGKPLMSRDNLDSLRVDNTSKAPLSPDLGIVATPLEEIAPQYLSIRPSVTDS
jgi:uncharacterized protein YbjT (DUF2867 family)